MKILEMIGGCIIAALAGYGLASLKEDIQVVKKFCKGLQVKK